MLTSRRASSRARSVTFAGAGALVLALVVTTATPFAGAAGAARRRTASVLPATDLSDQVARVAWSGFRPTLPDGTYGVSIFECKLHPRSVDKDCNTAQTFPLSLTGNAAQGVTQADGTGDALIDIESTARLPSLACSHSNPCSLLVFENTPNGFDPEHLPGAYATARLDFRENTADCPPPARFDVRLESEASAAAAAYQWAADLCSATPPFALDVTNTSSDAARAQFFQKHVDVALTSLPPAAGEAPASAPAYAVAPIDLTALVVAYNIVDPVTFHQITDVTLTPRLVARLVSDSDVLSFFQDPEFQKLNPHHTFPAQAADPGVRAEQNADTWLVTNWINADPAARAFLDGKDPYGVPVSYAWQGVKYPTNVFEARNPNGVYLPRTGEEEVAKRLFHATKPAEGTPKNPWDVGFFGILDLPTALRFGLPIAKLTTGVGKPVVSVDAQTIEAGYRAMSTSASGFHTEPPVPPDPSAWPLTKVDHAMVARAGDPATERAVARFLVYAAGPGRRTLPPGFVTLPDPLVAQTVRTAASILPPDTPSTPDTVPLSSDLGFGDISSSYLDSSTPSSPSAVGSTAPPASRSRHVARPATPRAVAIALSTPAPERFALPALAILALVMFAAGGFDAVRRRAPRVVGRVRSRRSPPTGASP